MNTVAKYSTSMRQLGLLALAAGLTAGCWEEVYYTPPPGGEPTSRRARDAQRAEASPHASEDPPNDSIGDLTAAGEPASAGSNQTRYSSTNTPPSSPSTESSHQVEIESAPLFDDTPSTEVEPPGYTESTPTKETTRPASPRYEPSTESTVSAAVESSSRYSEAFPPTNETQPTASATAAPLPAPPSRTDPARNTRRVAWLLGTKLSLAVLAHDRGGDPAEIQKWYDQSQSLAKMLGATVAPLPSLTSENASENQGIRFVFQEGQRIGRELANRYGNSEAALFELAVKANVLLTLYHPHADVVTALSESMEAASQRANLSAEVVAPLVKAVAVKAPYPTVRAAVYQMNRDIDRHLSVAQP